MAVRFTLAILFAVLAAASGPLATGGDHDLVAVGVRLRPADGSSVSRLVLAMPEERAFRAYDALLRSPARAALLQGNTAYVARRAGDGAEGVAELVFYGKGSRAGRAPVVFSSEPGASIAGAAETAEAASHLAALPDSVTAAAARVVLLETPDDAAFQEALEALATVRADVAIGEARRAARDRSLPATRRVRAIHVLKSPALRLDGPKVVPDLFRELADDPDPLVREAAR